MRFDGQTDVLFIVWNDRAGKSSTRATLNYPASPVVRVPTADEESCRSVMRASGTVRPVTSMTTPCSVPVVASHGCKPSVYSASWAIRRNISLLGIIRLADPFEFRIPDSSRLRPSRPGERDRLSPGQFNLSLFGRGLLATYHDGISAK